MGGQYRVCDISGSVMGDGFQNGLKMLITKYGKCDIVRCLYQNC